MLNVFVYGTLKPGEAYYQTYCEPYVAAATPALAQGCLYHLPQGYPALTEGNGWVTGARLSLRDQAAIALLDDFEDYDPTRPAAANDYIRHCRPVFTLDRKPLGLAWMYLMSVEQVQQWQGIRIADGVWSRQRWPSITPETTG